MFESSSLDLVNRVTRVLLHQRLLVAVLSLSLGVPDAKRCISTPTTLVKQDLREDQSAQTEVAADVESRFFFLANIPGWFCDLF